MRGEDRAAVEDGAPDGWAARSASAERWRVPLIASALVLAAGLVLEGWTGRADATSDTGGAALIAIGVAGALVSGLLAIRPTAAAPPRPARSATRGMAGSAVILAVGLPAIVWAASGVLLPEPAVEAATPNGTTALLGEPVAVIAESTPHEHAPGDPAGDSAGGSATGDPEFHTHGATHPEEPLDPATRAELGAQLTISREVALSYPTVADAEAAGYRAVTSYLPLIGAHYMRFANLVDGFVPEAPEMLLFDGTDPDSRIVGLSYFVIGDDAPEGFAGPNDHWHQHKGLCLKGTFVVGGERVSEEECARRGGRKAKNLDAWMVHAWVVPGWESPNGVFSPEHPGLI